MTDETQHDPTEWRYGDSRIAFRGPAVDPAAPHVAVVGSDEVAGRYVDMPMTAHVAEALGCPVANLGVHCGSLDALLRDEGALRALGGADVAVVQAMPAHMVSNRLYSVHPRRNDRVLEISRRMTALWPDVDFTDFVFVRHMLVTLRDRDPMRFAAVSDELETAWRARMPKLIAALPERRILVALRDADADPLGPQPLFVPQAAADEVAASFDAAVAVDLSGLRGHPSGLEEMVFEPEAAAAARLALPPEGHERAAAAIVGALAPLLAGTRLAPPATRHAVA